jgi:hypothetical protein
MMDKETFDAMVKDLTDGLLEAVMILMSDEGEKTKSGDLSNVDLVVATGDVQSPISNKEYQLQVSLVVNKDLWLEENLIGYRNTLGSFKVEEGLDHNQN